MNNFQTSKPQFDKNYSTREKEKCEAKPAFSLSHMTTNSKYTFKRLNDATEQKLAHQELYKILDKISTREWKDITSGGEGITIEYLHPDIVNLKPLPNDYVFRKGEKFISIRFGKDEYRLLAFKKNMCSILHIFGFDFKHDAYKH